jgi:hypothetical protein
MALPKAIKTGPQEDVHSEFVAEIQQYSDMSPRKILLDSCLSIGKKHE